MIEDEPGRHPVSHGRIEEPFEWIFGTVSQEFLAVVASEGIEPPNASLFSTQINRIYNNLSDTDGTVTHIQPGYGFLSVGTKVGREVWG
jgi:hypothetical protein